MLHHEVMFESSITGRAVFLKCRVPGVVLRECSDEFLQGVVRRCVTFLIRWIRGVDGQERLNSKEQYVHAVDVDEPEVDVLVAKEPDGYSEPFNVLYLVLPQETARDSIADA